MSKILFLGYSDIAIRRVIPAINKIGDISSIDISSRSKKVEASKKIKNVYKSYEDGIDESDCDVIYISLPNSLHFEYAMKSLMKQKNVIIIIIGHVTKEGTIAGPKMLEHMVDTVLYLEGDDRYEHRILRSAKHRFGATNEVGIFHMNEDGLNEVSNPSEMFLSERSRNIPGTCIYPSLEGTRPILIEVQALVSNANFGTPQRNVNGFDLRRLSMLLAVLEKRMDLVMGMKDVFINLVGGLKVDDPAADLSILCAIASSFMDKPMNENIVFIGEIGLTGEVRSISRLNHRLSEVMALGFSGAIVPSASVNEKIKKLKLKIYPVDSVKQTFDVLF